MTIDGHHVLLDEGDESAGSDRTEHPLSVKTVSDTINPPEAGAKTAGMPPPEGVQTVEVSGTLYHGTMPDKADSIAANGFQEGKNGALGPGNYFASDRSVSDNYGESELSVNVNNVPLASVTSDSMNAWMKDVSPSWDTIANGSSSEAFRVMGGGLPENPIDHDPFYDHTFWTERGYRGLYERDSGNVLLFYSPYNHWRSKASKKSSRPALVLKNAHRHEAQIDSDAPGLKKKLDAAHAKWVDEFWKNANLKQEKALLQVKSQPALTVAEAAALKQVVNDLTGDVWSQALYDDLSLIAETGYISAGTILQAAGVELNLDFNTVPAVTLDAIRKHCEQFAFMVNQREQQALFDVIDNAVAEGQTPAALAQTIAQAFKDGYHVDAERRVPTAAWSNMVARTELSRAQTMGNLALFDAAQIEKVMWVTSQGPNVCEEICLPRDGEILNLGDAEGEIPAHVMCACAFMAADDDVAYHTQEDF